MYTLRTHQLALQLMSRTRLLYTQALEAVKGINKIRQWEKRKRAQEIRERAETIVERSRNKGVL